MYYNKEFLKRLDENRTKTVYARIIALQLDESPIETIEGRVTQGSINIDGDSAVRRTCSLTMVAQDFDYNAFVWGLNTKFKLEIGLENTIDPTYPAIIWFKQGTYFISSFNTSHSTNSFNISIQGKDKMCALNGELGGALTSSVDFGTVEDIVEINGEKIVKITHLNIKDIIRNIVHLYGGEPLHNIIINDLDIFGLELLEYRYDVPMYLYRSIPSDTGYFENVTLDGNKVCEVNGNANRTLASLTSDELELLVNPMTGSSTPATIIMDGSAYHVAKINYGDTAGYRFTDLTYPGDLIGAAGETLVSILDKIKNMLGNFEYFYNLDGQFIFQQKRLYAQNQWEPTKNSNNDVIFNFIDNIAYTFNSGELITTFNNSFGIENVKNDYSVWGERSSISGAQIPIHMRYAIDKKPVYYKTLSGVEYTSSTYDWRELIYQMAKDYYSNTNNDDLEVLIAANNMLYYPTGKTGYEQYYIDIISFWRDLYNPTSERNLDNYYSDEHEYKYWNKIVYEAPQNLNFWFDFLDTDGALSQFSVKNIGSRPKIINDSNIKAIYFRETPNIIFTSNYEADSIKSGAYTYINARNAGMNTMFSISAQGKSAKSTIDELLQQYGYCAETVTMNIIPIYYLEPNMHIRVVDELAKIDGYYTVKKLSIPLTYNGTMSLTITKVVDTI